MDASSVWTGVLQVATVVLLLVLLYRPLGDYIAHIFTSDRDVRVERGLYRLIAVSLLAGTWVLQIFGIDITAFKIAGNLLVAAIGWAMLLARPSPVATNDPAGSPVVVPLAIPVIAGPGAIALAITFAHSYTSVIDYVAGLGIVIVVGLICSVVLYFGPFVAKLLGPAGMNVLTRIFGLLLLAIAVQSIVTSLGEALPGLMGTPSS